MLQQISNKSQFVVNYYTSFLWRWLSIMKATSDKIPLKCHWITSHILQILCCSDNTDWSWNINSFIVWNIGGKMIRLSVSCLFHILFLGKFQFILCILINWHQFKKNLISTMLEISTIIGYRLINLEFFICDEMRLKD